MTLETEALIDRRKLKRRLTLWRVGALLLGIGLITALALMGTNSDKILAGGNQIARVTISGLITDDRRQQELLRKLAEKEGVKAVILRINSPGGTTTGGEALYHAIRDISAKKPVVAVFGTVAASAAYMAGIAGDHIVARANTITGSVGVIFQWAEVHELLKKYGVKFEEIKSGKLKATPSPFRPADEEGLAVARELVEDSFNWFLNLVAARRKLKPDAIPGLREGRIYSGRQALKYDLVDEIGGEKTARSWLETKREIEADLPIKDWKPERDYKFDLLTGLVRVGGSLIGLSAERLEFLLTSNSVAARLRLDGLVSLWHPSGS